jgi:uncharacterized protein (TIGR03435 family)
MKRAVLCAVGLIAMLGAAMDAQTITGTWQGALPSPDNSRLVVKIEKSPDGSFHGGLIRVDRNADGLPLTSVTFSAPDVNLSQVTSASSFKGKLSADGHSIEGTWTEGQNSSPLTLVLATPETTWKHDGPAAIPPMAATADPGFDVAIIKPARPDENQTLFNLIGRKFTANHCTAVELIKIAYYVRGKQVTNGAPWTASDLFDVVAEPDAEGIPSEQQNRDMVRKMLEDRFHLVSHTIQQPFNVLSVTADKNINLNRAAIHPADPEFNGHASYFARMNPDGNIIFQYSSVTIKQFIGLIMNIYQANLIVDDSGIDGSYDITLTVPTSDLMNSGASGGPADEGNALIAAAKQIGLHFTPKKEPLPVIVIDHIDKPTPN